MADFKGLEGQYDDINQVGSRPVGLMTEFTTEAGRPIYISNNGEIVSEKSTTIPYNGKYVNVPSIHDGIEYSEFELRKLLDEKKIKPTSTHKTQELAIKAAQKRSPSLMSEETARAVESKYWKEMTKRKATADQILGDSSTELVTPDAKANIQMRNLELISEDDFLGLVDPSEKTDKLDAYMSTLSEQDKSNIQKTLKKPKARINSIEGDESMAKGRARRNLEDQTVSAFAEGGMEDGGLKDEGGTVDPVSGNDVPSGSTQTEVRDDIPAQLSEGEFVLPADVVRYIGLENLMELRAKAKQGLARMEQMGQMGNSDEATMDDSGEYDGEIDELIESFDPNDPSTFEFNEGGVVMAQQGTYVPPTTGQQQFSYGYGYGAGTGYTPPGQQPVQYPQYGQFISRPAQQAAGQQPPQIEDRQYIGPNGELITIRFMNGKPQQEVPAGFKVYKPEEVKPEVVAPTVTPTDTGGGDRDGSDTGTTDATADMLDGLAAKGFLSENITNIGKDYNNKALMTAGAFLLSGPAGFPGAVASGEIAKNSVEEQLAAQMGITVEEFNKDYVEKSGPFGLNRKYNEDKIASKLSETYAISEGAVMGDVKDTSVGSYDSEGNLVGGGAFDRARRDALDAVKSGNVAKAKSAMEEAKAAGWTPDSSAADTSGEASQSTSTPDRDASGDVGGGRGSDPSGGASGSPFSKGGLAEQTQRVLKSARKKK